MQPHPVGVHQMAIYCGVILGGLSENLSMMLGFNYLLLVAMAFYGLAMALRPKLNINAPALGFDVATNVDAELVQVS